MRVLAIPAHSPPPCSPPWPGDAGATCRGARPGVLYLLISVGLNPQDAQATTFEVFLLPWTAAAMRCADRGRWGAAGMAVAGAFLTKQTGGAVLLARAAECCDVASGAGRRGVC